MCGGGGLGAGVDVAVDGRDRLSGPCPSAVCGGSVGGGVGGVDGAWWGVAGSVAGWLGGVVDDDGDVHGDRSLDVACIPRAPASPTVTFGTASSGAIGRHFGAVPRRCRLLGRPAGSDLVPPQHPRRPSPPPSRRGSPGPCGAAAWLSLRRATGRTPTHGPGRSSPRRRAGLETSPGHRHVRRRAAGDPPCPGATTTTIQSLTTTTACRTPTTTVEPTPTTTVEPTTSTAGTRPQARPPRAVSARAARRRRRRRRSAAGCRPPEVGPGRYRSSPPVVLAACGAVLLLFALSPTDLSTPWFDASSGRGSPAASPGNEPPRGHT